MERTVFVDNLKDASQKREEENEDGAEEEKNSELVQCRTASLLYRRETSNWNLNTNIYISSHPEVD